jgi:hypothetical protein
MTCTPRSVRSPCQLLTLLTVCGWRVPRGALRIHRLKAFYSWQTSAAHCIDVARFRTDMTVLNCYCQIWAVDCSRVLISVGLYGAETLLTGGQIYYTVILYALGLDVLGSRHNHPQYTPSISPAAQ